MLISPETWPKVLLWNKIMRNICVLIHLILFHYSLYTQELRYSKPFPSVSKNLPLVLLNKHPAYFHVLRYNRLAHDITLERRSKNDAGILCFTPLKLDSVNADWFNYANLDFQLIESDYSVYFVFKKELNNKKSLYLKRIDTLGKSSGFFEILSLEREPAWTDFEITYKNLDNGKLLIITTREFFNMSVKKTALLFDLNSHRILWTKHLPSENPFTGYSRSFTCDNNQNLYYLMVNSQVIGFKRKYSKHMQVETPVMRYDSIKVVSFLKNNEKPHSLMLLKSFNRNNSITLWAETGKLYVLSFYSRTEEDSPAPGSFLFSFCSGQKLDTIYYQQSTPLDTNIGKRLTYFDGTDIDSFWDKEFKILSADYNQSTAYNLCERREAEEYKELFFWNTDLSTGKVVNQQLIPRRLLSSEAWSRYANIGEAGACLVDSSYFVFMAEFNQNFNANLQSVKFPQLKKRSSLRFCNLILIELKRNHPVRKILLHQNGNFDFIPVPYQSAGQRDLIFYFSSGRQERFAICELNRN
jgi:hypothetical protein